MARPFRVAYFVTHPIQYQAPLLRTLAGCESLDLTVHFLSDLSLRGYHDSGFGRDVSWDVPLVEGFRHVFLPAVGSTADLSFLRPLSRGIAAALDGGGYDAVWVHGYAHQALIRAVAAARHRGLPVLLRGESHLASHPRGRLRAIVKDVLLQWLFRRVAAFLAIGRLNADYYVHYGAAADRVFPMPYAVDNAFFRARAAQSAPGRDQLVADLRLPGERPIVLFASKLIERKRPGDVIEACATWRREDPATAPSLVLVGDGPLRPSLEARGRALGLDLVRFVGFRNQSELPAYYDLCDVFALASEHEPWGLVVNEVMNAGRPVVVSDEVGAGPDLVEDGVNGAVVPVGDVDGLSRALRRVAASRDRAREMGRRSLARVDRYSFESDRDGLLAALSAVVVR